MCKSISVPTFHLLYGHKTSSREGIYGSLHFSEISAISQIRKAPRRLLAASVDSRFPPTQNNPMPKWLIWGGMFRSP